MKIESTYTIQHNLYPDSRPTFPVDKYVGILQILGKVNILTQFFRRSSESAKKLNLAQEMRKRCSECPVKSCTMNFTDGPLDTEIYFNENGDPSVLNAFIGGKSLEEILHQITLANCTK